MPPPRFSSRTTAAYERVITWLNARVNYERTPAACRSQTPFHLGRIRQLLHDLGDPHLSYPVAHVAGTKGKGSTVAMLASILAESGHRVGSYLSPHVHRIEERIAINGDPITPGDFMARLDAIIPVVERIDRAARRRGRHGPTWFEVMTGLAFTHFAACNVDIVVLETGIGGRLDATNVCHPLVTIITSIGFDHMRLLGSTITQITGEKAGIIKRYCPVVSGAKQPAAQKVIAVTAARRRAPLLQAGRDFIVRHVEPASSRGVLGGTMFELDHGAGTTPQRYSLRLAGRHQAENAALAIIAAEQLQRRGIRLDHETIRCGLSKAELPARIQTISTRPLVVVDAAHNVPSMKALAATMRPVLALVFAASADKQIARMLAKATGVFRHLVLTRYRTNPRAATVEKLLSAATRAGFQAPRVAEGPGEAMSLARKLAGPRGLICVAGSFFLASEVRQAT